MSKEKFYKTINILVGTNRIDNEEAYIINDYASTLENIIKEVRERINNYTTRFDVLNYQISDLTKKELLEILNKGE